MKMPDWYWSRGLHDAMIISAETTETKESRWKPDANCLVLKLNCHNALFERDIKEIRFFNFKILTEDFDINSLTHGFWLSDELVLKGEGYLLDLKFETEKCKTRRLEMKFQKAEVVRDNNLNYKR